MDSMLAAAQTQIADLHARLRKTIEDTDPASLDWKPGAETNSVAVLAIHMLGSEELVVSTIAGAPVARDRDAEFRTVGLDKASLLARLDQVDARVRAWLASIDESRLATTYELFGGGRTGAVRLFSTITHLAEHIGQAQLTCQLWAQAGAGQQRPLPTA